MCQSKILTKWNVFSTKHSKGIHLTTLKEVEKVQQSCGSGTISEFWIMKLSTRLGFPHKLYCLFIVLILDSLPLLTISDFRKPEVHCFLLTFYYVVIDTHTTLICQHCYSIRLLYRAYKLRNVLYKLISAISLFNMTLLDTGAWI
jgi:hypothetical protein